MMSTPFFYRLNDVYQSSTVYLTFPSNRTKRYEHSLGTMDLTGKIFYSAVTNTSPKDKLFLLKELLKQFETILEAFETRADIRNIQFYNFCSDRLSELIPKSESNANEFMALLRETVNEKPLFDFALCKQEVCFLDLLGFNNVSYEQIQLYSFLYQCALQALRVAALFHDIGHPPFSHIIEYTLKRIYNDIDSSRYEPNKVKEFKGCLQKYIECEPIEQMILPNDTFESDPALHEQIGLDILYNAFQGVTKKLVEEWAEQPVPVNHVKAIYLVTVIEFSLGILLEKAPVFSSLHRIIDGPVDSDRMDYVVRDSKNSGVNWGVIPYQRLISGIKFSFCDGLFSIAFPEKVADDIDDLIVNRYKVFQRINYHHKSVKSSELMQRVVEELAKDYLANKKGEEIIPEIKDLWCSLSYSFGQLEVENKISKWTDSWLTSVLSNTLIRLSDPKIKKELLKNNSYRSDDYINRIVIMLNEVLLNRKRYFPVLKRQRDAVALINRIIETSNANKETLQKIITHEYNTLISAMGETSVSAQESLHRISILQDQIFSMANLGLLDIVFPGEKDCFILIKDELEKAKENRLIEDYFMCQNSSYTQLGVNDDAPIFLYRSNGDANESSQTYRYNIKTTLKRKLQAQRVGSLWLFVYVRLPDTTENEAEKVVAKISDNIANAIGCSLRKVLNILFKFDSLSDT